MTALSNDKRHGWEARCARLGRARDDNVKHVALRDAERRRGEILRSAKGATLRMTAWSNDERDG